MRSPTRATAWRPPSSTFAITESRATGEIGDSDPLDAAADAVHSFPADQIVVSTYPEGHSNWLERNLPERLWERLGQPVTHLISRFGMPADQ